MYFDLGKFKDELFAQNIRDKVAKLGLRTNVIPKGHLWMNSFQVLVGPYTEEDEAKKAHRELLSQDDLYKHLHYLQHNPFVEQAG